MSDNSKEAEKQMANEIFVSDDDWLSVFALLAPGQLGLGIALLSRRFDRRVDEHFKTRRWSLGVIVLECQCQRRTKEKRHKNGDGMKIRNSKCKSLPIPEVPLPNKVVGFRCILIRSYNGHELISFLDHFRHLFASSPANLSLRLSGHFPLDFAILCRMWTLIRANLCEIEVNDRKSFQNLRRVSPSALRECPALRWVCCPSYFEFPADDSANASYGQAVAKWLFTPRPDGVPKLFYRFFSEVSWQKFQGSSTIDALKSAFANASSPASFFIQFRFSFCFDDAIQFFVPFSLRNEFTGERLTLTHVFNIAQFFLLTRRPISPAADKKWAQWEKEGIEWQWQFGYQCNKLAI